MGLDGDISTELLTLLIVDFVALDRLIVSFVT